MLFYHINHKLWFMTEKCFAGLSCQYQETILLTITLKNDNYNVWYHMHFIMKRCISNFQKFILVFAHFFSFISNMTFLIIYLVKTLILMVLINKKNENKYLNATRRNKLENSAGRNILVWKFKPFTSLSKFASLKTSKLDQSTFKLQLFFSNFKLFHSTLFPTVTNCCLLRRSETTWFDKERFLVIQ